MSSWSPPLAFPPCNCLITNCLRRRRCCGMSGAERRPDCNLHGQGCHDGYTGKGSHWNKCRPLFKRDFLGEVVFLRRGNKGPPKYTRVENSSGKEKTEGIPKEIRQFPFFRLFFQHPRASQRRSYFSQVFPKVSFRFCHL